MKYIAQPTLEHFNAELKYMNPKRYLELSIPRKTNLSRFNNKAYDQKSLDRLSTRLAKELEIDPPMLVVDIETKNIVDHSGRHRAFTAYELGFNKIPVFIKYVKHRKTITGKIKQIKIPKQEIPESMEFRSEVKIRPWEVKFE